jgi:hypothetical protein
LVSDEQAREAAREILARDEFARWSLDFEAWLRSLEALIELIPRGLIEALAWFQEVVLRGIVVELLQALGRLLDLMGVFGDAPSATLGWIAVCLLLAGSIVLGVRLRRRHGLDRTPGGARRATSQSHAAAIEQARALAEGGQYLEAAHRTQLATLALLIEVDWLELARSDPNRTLRRRIAESVLPEAERRQLTALVDRLESLWFDEPREDRELFEAWMALDDRISSLARRGWA